MIYIPLAKVSLCYINFVWNLSLFQVYLFQVLGWFCFFEIVTDNMPIWFFIKDKPLYKRIENVQNTFEPKMIVYVPDSVLWGK